MARRRLDQFGEIVGLDIERPRIIERPADLGLIEDALHERHDSEILHRLVSEAMIS
jgi:hypothetical protein